MNGESTHWLHTAPVGQVHVSSCSQLSYLNTGTACLGDVPCPYTSHTALESLPFSAALVISPQGHSLTHNLECYGEDQ